MVARIQLRPEQITKDDLVKVFDLFCKIYGLEPSESDKRFLTKHGLEDLKSPIGLGYRFSALGKFFGQRSGDSIRFWGYANPEERKKEKNEEFQRAVKDYFSKKLIES